MQAAAACAGAKGEAAAQGVREEAGGQGARPADVHPAPHARLRGAGAAHRRRARRRQGRLPQAGQGAPPPAPGLDLSTAVAVGLARDNTGGTLLQAAPCSLQNVSSAEDAPMTVHATLRCAESCVVPATVVASGQASGEPGRGQGQVSGDPARVRLAHVHGRGRAHRGAGAQVTWQPRACGGRARSVVPAVRGPAQLMRRCMLRASSWLLHRSAS